MRIGILTSSRADFGIYLPLLDKLSHDPFFELTMIAFGTHLSKKHGQTIYEIEKANVGKIDKVESVLEDGDAHAVSRSYGDMVIQFSSYWSKNNFDLVLALGDRYEMSAAVQASIPFGVKIAHFHGGETTLGAIDNIYRHQITLASKYHFTATKDFSERVAELIGNNPHTIFDVGSISLATLNEIPLLSRQELVTQYELPDQPFVLCTFHPETMEANKNDFYSDQMIQVLTMLPEGIHAIVCMPNVDTNGDIYRKKLLAFKGSHTARVTLIESFGKINYFSAMKHSEFLLGNSSSGIIEAASFGKYVVNVGDRQKGRLQSGNVIDVPFERKKISDAIVHLLATSKTFSGQNKYVKNNTLEIISEKLRAIGHGEL